MERDWNVQDGSDCDLNSLPLVRTWPSLAPHAEAVERLVLMGAIEDDELRDVLLRSPRGVHALPLPIGHDGENIDCLLYTSPSPRDKRQSRMPSSA